MAGIFEEGLMDEVGAAVAPMHPVLVLATLLGHRGDPTILLDGSSIGITGALAPEGAGKPGCEGRPGAGEALPDERIAVEPKEMVDLLVVLFDGKAELE